MVGYGPYINYVPWQLERKNALVDERECGAGEEDVEDGDPKVDFLCRLLGVLVAGVGEVLPVQRWEEEGGEGQLGPNLVSRGLPCNTIPYSVSPGL